MLKILSKNTRILTLKKSSKLVPLYMANPLEEKNFKKKSYGKKILKTSYYANTEHVKSVYVSMFSIIFIKYIFIKDAHFLFFFSP